MSTNQALLQFLQSRVESLLATPPEDGASAKEQAAYGQRLRQARLRLARAKGSHTVAEWEAIVAETAGICVRCGYQHNLEFERPCKAYVVPIALGGSNAIDNLQPLCTRCARGKGDERVNWLAAWRRAKPS